MIVAAIAILDTYHAPALTLARGWSHRRVHCTLLCADLFRMTLVTCLCSVCKTETYTDELGVHPGRRIAYSTRSRHEDADRRRVSSDQDDAQEAVPSASIAAQAEDIDEQALHGILRHCCLCNSRADGHLAQNEAANVIATMCCVLLLWLRLCAGASRSTTRKVGGLLTVVIAAFSALLIMVLTAAHASFTLPPIKIPLDERTMLRHLELEPTILRSVHCPRCFTAYTLQGLPSHCSYKASPRAKVCNEPLKRWRHTRRGRVLVPRCLYSTQSFESWLQFFLSRPYVEEQLEGPFRPRPADGIMRDIWDSPAWRSLEDGAYTLRKHNLVFSLYLDWFNPLGNKISGKVISCGAIMLACMNLPPELRYLPENVFFAGIMPPPLQADVATITNLTNPIVDSLAPLYEGKVIPTALHPDGIQVRVAVLPIIADLPAIRKLCGYAGHNAELLCSYCHLTYSEIEDLDWTAWTRRTKEEVRDAATAWRDAPTLSARDKITSEHGVRWSPLHRLDYWDPVRSLVPGMMHNVAEGEAIQLLRVLWGIGAPDAVVRAYKETQAQEDEDYGGYDSSDYDAELEALAQESQESGQSPPALPSRLCSHTISATSTISDDEDVVMDDGSTPRADSDPDFESLGTPELCAFSDNELEDIRTCIRDITLPTWVSRPPGTLGEAAHGKLKADVILVLFTVVLPSIIPEIWTRPEADHRRKVLLENFCHLVSAVNIVSLFSTSESLADKYMEHFISYRRTRRQLWPNHNSVPNDHIAMHNGEALKFWGPLAQVSEFPYERLNGVLASIPTNRRNCKSSLL